MKIINCEQNTKEWYEARLGKPTASQFDRIITANGRISTQWREYMGRLIAERVFQRPMNEKDMNFWMRRGKEFEAKAADVYARMTGETLEEVGFITTDDGLVGCSPDRLIISNDGKRRALEIKVPTPWKHMAYTLFGPGTDYYVQMQGQMYVAELDEVDFFSYNPGMPSSVYTMKRNAKFIKDLRNALKLFTEELDKFEAEARKLGNYEWTLPEEKS